MRTQRCFAIIDIQEINRTFKYNNTEMLKLTIKYPIINIYNRPFAERKINNNIEMQVQEYFRYATNTLYNEAVNSYMESLKNDYPFHGFEAYMEYKITYNDNCFLSLYADKYEFRGGAHGYTTRKSDTYELCTGEYIYLYCFFKPYTDYELFITQEIIIQAENNLIDNPGIYFEDYKNLIAENFNPNNFYMSPDGITFYYLQYEIAPYSTGIVEFTIPYKTIGWYPSC